MYRITPGKEFKYVNVWLDLALRKVERTTYVLSANNKMELPQAIYSQRGFQRRWLRINAPLEAAGTSSDALPVLTDDFVPVELLLAGLLFGGEAL